MNILQIENFFLLLISIWSLVVGWGRYPNGRVKTLLYRFNCAFVFYGFMEVAFIQISRVIKGGDLEEWQYAAIFSITLLCSLLVFFLPWIAILLAGSYIGFICGTCLTLLYEFKSKSAMLLVIEGLGLLGLFLAALIAYQSEILRHLTLLWVSGIFLLISLACTVNLPVIKPYIYFLTDQTAYDQYQCSRTANSGKDGLSFITGSIAIAFGALIFQLLIGILLNRFIQTRVKAPEKRPDIPDISYRGFVNRISDLCNPNPELQAKLNRGEINGQRTVEHDTMEEDRAQLEKVLRGLNKMIDPKHEGQFHGVAKSLHWKPSKVRRKVINWLRNNGNFKPSSLQVDSNYQYSSVSNAKGISLQDLLQQTKWDHYVDKKVTIGNDYISLIALPQIFDVKIELYTCIDKIVYKMVLERDSNQLRQDRIRDESLMFNNSDLIHDSIEIHDSQDFDHDVYSSMETNQKDFLRKHGFETESDITSSEDERVNTFYKANDPIKKTRTVTLYHYGKRKYGVVVGLDDSLNEDDDDDNNLSDDELEAPLDSPTVMTPEENGIYKCIQSGSHNMNRLSIVLVVVTGIWWLVYMPVWGQTYNPEELWGIFGFFIFYIAELINYVLGLVYMANFLSPCTRRWKSMDQLKGTFVPRPHVNTMIFHCSEPIDDTQRTLDGCLKMDTINGRIKHSVYICDDGHWDDVVRKDYEPKSIVRFPELKKLFGKIKSCFSCSDILVTPSSEIDHVEPLEICNRKSTPEKEALEWIQKRFGKQQSKIGKSIKRMIQTAMKEHYEELYNMNNKNEKKAYKEGIKIQYYCRLTKLREDGGGRDGFGCIIRRDCAAASLCYTFQAVLPGEDKETSLSLTRVHLVARVKARGQPHHYKSGNINNCIYNEIQPDDDRFLSFFDNDMRPEKAFLIRTLPFFYMERNNTLQIQKRVSYVQTPQFFTSETLAPVLDYLASKNSIFFQAIQKGRDGFDACAFAGTNAVFRAGAIKAIGGFPYGSVTEDAYCGRLLHIEGYTSVYAEEMLAVGTAPTTPGSAMKQRMRWCKGSVQLLILSLFGKPPNAKTSFQPGLAPARENVKELIMYKNHEPFSHNLVKKCFSLDTMLYPVSAITAIGYMFVALLFVFSAQSPIQFQTQFGYMIFFFTFVPYFGAKFLSSLTAYTGKVDADEIWVAQEVWFSYAFPAVVGIIDAARERLTGVGFKWGVTGEAGEPRNNWLEYFNMLMLFALTIGIVYRLVNMLFFSSPAEVLVDFGAIFFAGTIVFQMWPMVSMSLYEMLRNSNVEKDQQKELHRFKIPTFVSYCVILMIVLAIGLVAEPKSCDPGAAYL